MPQGLPPLVLLEESQGDWPRYLALLYGFFRRDFVDSHPSWPGKRVGLKRYPEYEGKSATFWHFISEGSDEAERIPDLRRCERIRWPRAIMDRFALQRPAPEAELVWWKSWRGRDESFVLALADFSYVVVVADRGEFVLPWTAYYVPQQHRQNKLRKEYGAYWTSQKG